MNSSKKHRIYIDWNKCLPEIYRIIFNMLEAKDLIACLFVNRTWRTILENDARIDWQKVAAIALPDRGLDMKRKSNLDWKGVVLKSGIWTYGVDQLKIQLLHEYKSQEDFQPTMTVYRDMLYVGTRNHSECIYIESQERTNLEEHCNDMYLFDESDHIRVLHDGNNKLRLIGKKTIDLDGTSCPETAINFESTSSKVFLLDEDRCYIFQVNKFLKVFIWADQQWESKYVARYYGSTDLNTMVMFRRQLLLMGRHGDLWRVSVEDRQFRKVATFKTPSVYHQSNAKVLMKIMLSAIGTRSDFHNKEVIVVRKSTIFEKGVTCATLHAGILFLAYSNGQIDAWILKNHLEGPNEEECHHIAALSYEQTVQYANNDDFYINLFCERRFHILRLEDRIYNMTVYEGQTFSYLFINCGHTIYQYQLAFPGFV